MVTRKTLTFPFPWTTLRTTFFLTVVPDLFLEHSLQKLGIANSFSAPLKCTETYLKTTFQFLDQGNVLLKDPGTIPSKYNPQGRQHPYFLVSVGGQGSNFNGCLAPNYKLQHASLLFLWIRAITTHRSPKYLPTAALKNSPAPCFSRVEFDLLVAVVLNKIFLACFTLPWCSFSLMM